VRLEGCSGLLEPTLGREIAVATANDNWFRRADLGTEPVSEAHSDLSLPGWTLTLTVVACEARSQDRRTSSVRSFAAALADGSASIGRGMTLAEQLAELRSSVPVTVKCGHCSFLAFAPLEEARAAFEQHDCDRPKPEPSKRRPGGFRFR
jgi:bacterioferritin-associated ferredoxin